jgi:integrase
VKARWEEMDLDNKLWVIPAETMKTKVEHRVPLTEQTINLLERLKLISGKGEFLFPSNTKTKHHASESTANVALKRMGFQGRQTAHGLRGLARTTIEEEGFNHHACEACLAHKNGTQVSQAYNHATYLSQRIKIMEWWSKYIESASIGNVSLSGQKGLKVVNS